MEKGKESSWLTSVTAGVELELDVVDMETGRSVVSGSGVTICCVTGAVVSEGVASVSDTAGETGVAGSVSVGGLVATEGGGSSGFCPSESWNCDL